MTKNNMQFTTITAVSLLLFYYLWDVEARDIISTLKVSNGGKWGKWGKKEFCPSGYATGFILKVEPYQGFFRDDSSLNGIRLHCPDGSFITSTVGLFGNWHNETSCKSGYLNSFSLRVTPPKFLDNTAADNIKFKCTDGTELEGTGHAWGKYGAWSQSCKNGGICGLETKVERPRGWSALDHTELNDVKFFCCR